MPVASPVSGRIAIRPDPQLGDGLAVLGLAHSLTLSGYDVTVFSDLLSQLDDLLPYHVAPRKDLSNGWIEDRDTVAALFIQRTVEDLPDSLLEKVLFYDYSKSNWWRTSTALAGIKRTHAFAPDHGGVISRFRPFAPVLDSWEAYCREKLHLPVCAAILAGGWHRHW